MKIIYYLKLIRIQNIAIACMTVLLTAYLIDNYNAYNIMKCMLLILLSMSFGNIMNDIVDFKIDQINQPKRVINQNFVSIYEAKILCFIFLIGSFFSSFLLNDINAQLFFYIILIILITYNLFFKKIAIIGNLLIAVLLSSVFLFSELVLTGNITSMFLPSFLAFYLSFIRENIKDLHDFKGDYLLGMKTLPAICGIKTSSYLISFFILVAIILFTMPFIYQIYGWKYFVLLILFIEIPLIYSLFLLLYFQTIKRFKQLVHLYKALTILGLFVIFATKS